MIILITGASHTGKTVLAQKLLEKYQYPYLSIDILKTGLIRSGYTNLTPEDDSELELFLWPIIREMIKTAVENEQDVYKRQAFALGASGVQVGTCLLVSEECPIHQNYKEAICKAGDTDTIVTGRIGGTPVRILRNKMAREYIKREKEGASAQELELYTLGSLRKAVIDGDVQNGSLMAGQVAGLCNEIKPLKEIIDGLFEDYKEAYLALEKEV